MSTLSEVEVSDYDAPFPDDGHKAGAHKFPVPVPDRPDDRESESNRKAMAVIRNLLTPVLTDFGAEDRIWPARTACFRNSVRVPQDSRIYVSPKPGILCRRMYPKRLLKPYWVLSGARPDPGYSRISFGSTPHRLLLGAQPP